MLKGGGFGKDVLVEILERKQIHVWASLVFSANGSEIRSRIDEKLPGSVILASILDLLQNHP